MSEQQQEFDPVTRPRHYNSHPSGIECIEITRHMAYHLGNAVKYVFRTELKNGLQDLEKALFSLDDHLGAFDSSPVIAHEAKWRLLEVASWESGARKGFFEAMAQGWLHLVRDALITLITEHKETHA